MNAIEMKDDTSRGIWRSIFLPLVGEDAPNFGKSAGEGRRFSTKQGWNMPNPSPFLHLPGHPLSQGERESKRLFMLYQLYHDKYIHAIALIDYLHFPHNCLK
jgi:hypothetical protein